MTIGHNKPSECMMIGDSLTDDVIGALNEVLQAIHYTRGDELDLHIKK